jgi:hydrogenase maturation protein HypF
VLGLVLDDESWGAGGARRGGEFLRAGYRDVQQVGQLKAVPLPGGAEAAGEPGQALRAHLDAAMGRAQFTARYPGLQLYADLDRERGVTFETAPEPEAALAACSSCAVLMQAVAAALQLVGARQSFRNEAALRLEAIVDETTLRQPHNPADYPIALDREPSTGLLTIETLAMWRALLDDMARQTPRSIAAARFHRWLSASIAAVAQTWAIGAAEEPRSDTIVLSGSCFENRILLEETERLLREQGWVVLTHRRAPPGDGGLALGQAAVAAAQALVGQL